MSAPSGAGKTTLCKKILEIFPDIHHSVSYTTRKPRMGEKDGMDYYFISKEKFFQMVEEGKFAEWAIIYENQYGTSLDTVLEAKKTKIDFILDIDVQGAKNLLKKFKEGVYIFLLPPSVESLRQRLLNRKDTNQEEVEKRLGKAKEEMAEVDYYDYILINDKLDETVEGLKSIILAERCKRENMEEEALNILREFNVEKN